MHPGIAILIPILAYHLAGLAFQRLSYRYPLCGRVYTRMGESDVLWLYLFTISVIFGFFDF